MRSNLQVITPPLGEPVSVETALAHLRIDTDADNLLLGLYLASARTMVEQYSNRCLIATGLRWSVTPDGDFGHGRRYRALELPRSPVISVASVKTFDLTGAATTLDPSIYLIDMTLVPGVIRLDFGSGAIYMPAVERFEVEFVAGYGANGSAVPLPIINAILVTTMFLYEHRGDAGGEIPKAAEWLLNPYRVNYFGG
jgi:uncharacterized phiE125 gp8 family phage protein